MTEQEQEYGEAWRPTPGDHLSGTVVSIEAIDPNGQGAYPCVQVRGEDGSLKSIHAFHSVLRRELARRAPRVGDNVSVTYLGKKADAGQHGTGYHNYRVTGGQEREFNWDRELPAEERSRFASDVPIAPAATPFDDMGPIVRPPEPTPQEKAQQFGEEPPF